MRLDRNTASLGSISGSDSPRQDTQPGFITGFVPAFRHLETGEVRLCRMEDGRISRDHLLDGLPDHWIMDRDPSGRPSALVYAIEPGFVRGIQFWSFQDLAHPAMDG